MNRFASRVALVTGAGSGIGEEIVKSIAAEGGRVVVLDIREDAAARVAQQIVHDGGEALSLQADVASSRDVGIAIDKVLKIWGQLDVLVNNAGFSRGASLVDISDAEFKSLIDVILVGTFFVTRATVPSMIKRGYGRIVNISSRVYLGAPQLSAYSAAKAAIIGLTKSLALELGHHNITVNAVAPGFIETPGGRSDPAYDDLKVAALTQSPVGRVGYPRDVANAVLFLASEDASFITGDIMHVTGGRFA